MMLTQGVGDGEIADVKEGVEIKDAPLEADTLVAASSGALATLQHNTMVVWPCSVSQHIFLIH